MRKVVMIADDSPTIRKIVEIVLCRQGYEVVAVPDGVAARRSLMAMEKTPARGVSPLMCREPMGRLLL